MSLNRRDIERELAEEKLTLGELNDIYDLEGRDRQVRGAGSSDTTKPDDRAFPAVAAADTSPARPQVLAVFAPMRDLHERVRIPSVRVPKTHGVPSHAVREGR